MVPGAVVPSAVPEPYVRVVPLPEVIQPAVPEPLSGNQVIVFAVTVTPEVPPLVQLFSERFPMTLAEATGIKLKQPSTTTAVNTKPLLLLLRILLFLSLSF
jgi:hypothetical protein